MGQRDDLPGDGAVTMVVQTLAKRLATAVGEAVDRVWGRLPTLLLLVLFVLMLHGEQAGSQDMEHRLDMISGGRLFDFTTWELRALTQKLVLAQFAPQRFMDEGARAEFVLHYLNQVAEAQGLDDEIERSYSDPEATDPAVATVALRGRLAQLRSEIERTAPIAEAILGEQVGNVLADAGFGLWRQLLPPVSGMFTPLPYVLIVSPRDRIESVYQRQLVAGLTAADQQSIEAEIEGALPDVSAYTTGIGGLAAYPAMYLESSSLGWVVDVVAHEWTHHYLTFYPLSWYYEKSGEARTINETTASLLGEWASQEVLLRYYAPLTEIEKRLPDPLQRVQEAAGTAAPRFDFQAEMHHTRVIVDEMLAAGKVEESEWYMEAQRRYFVANGYRLRRLNQAYFAFHGAYASSAGAAGKDPIGPAVRQLWAVSLNPRDFLREIAHIITLGELQAALAAS